MDAAAGNVREWERTLAGATDRRPVSHRSAALCFQTPLCDSLTRKRQRGPARCHVAASLPNLVL